MEGACSTGGENTRRLVYGVLEFLQDELNNDSTSENAKEGLEVAMQCLETSYGITLKDTGYKPRRCLRDLVESVSGNGGGNNSCGNAFTGSAYISTGEKYVKPEASEADKRMADDFKNKGNDAMMRMNYGEALDHYNKAIELDGGNAVYFCNRAAAFNKLEQYDKALRDCQIALQLRPSYTKAYGRMGVTYSSQNNHVDAILCYKQARDLEPDNDTYKKNMEVAQQMILQDLSAAQANAAASPNLRAFFGIPNWPSLASQLFRDTSIPQTLLNAAQSLQESSSNGSNVIENLLQAFRNQTIDPHLQHSNQNQSSEQEKSSNGNTNRTDDSNNNN